MKQTNNIKPRINNIKKSLQGQVNGIKKVGALLYLCLLPLLIPKQTSIYKRFQNYSYKALATCDLEGYEMLSAFMQPEFETDFRKWLNEDRPYQSRHPIISRIDASKLGHHYGKNIPGLKWLYDYVTRCNIKTLCIYVLLITIGDKEYIGGYVIPWSEGDEKAIGSNHIAQNLLEAFCNALPTDLVGSFKKWSRISLDGDWGSGSMLAWLKGNGYHHNAVKSGGKDIVIDSCGTPYKSLREFQDMLIVMLEDSPLYWRRFNPCYHLDGILYYTEKARLKTSNLEVQVVLLKYPVKKADHKDRYLMLLSIPEHDWHCHQIVKAYKGRWSIETMFKTGKQRFDWEKIGYHIKTVIHYPSKGVVSNPTEKEMKDSLYSAFQRINRYLALRFISYMAVNWYRVECTRPSQTSLAQAIGHWNNYFDDLSPKAFQNLFAGYS